MSGLAALLPKHEGDELPDALRRLPPGDLLLGYQQRALELLNGTSLLVIEKSRRVGLTWGLASWAVLCAAAARSAGGSTVYYLGYNLDMAREFIGACGMWGKAFALAAEAADEIVFDEGKDAVKAFRIQFASGFSVVALPSMPRSLRGMQGRVIVDEAAFHTHLEEVLKAALALLIWGGQVVVVSTHDGVENPFNLLLQEVRGGRRLGKTMRITFADAMADGLYERIQLVAGKAANENDPEAWVAARAAWEAQIRGIYGDGADEELDCIPRAGAGAWLDPLLIAAAEHSEAGRPELYGGGPTWIGRDIAIRKDKSVIWAFEEVGNVLWLRERWEVVKATFAEQDAAFDTMMRQYKVMRAAIDQTGMGEKVVEDAVKRHGSRVEGVIFTGTSKLDMATALRQRFEAGTIRIPGDDVIRADFRAIKRVRGPSGAARLAEMGEVHADLFWAAALAAAAAAGGVVPAAGATVDSQPDAYIPTGRSGGRGGRLIAPPGFVGAGAPGLNLRRHPWG